MAPENLTSCSESDVVMNPISKTACSNSEGRVLQQESQSKMIAKWCPQNKDDVCILMRNSLSGCRNELHAWEIWVRRDATFPFAFSSFWWAVFLFIADSGTKADMANSRFCRGGTSLIVLFLGLEQGLHCYQEEWGL